MQLQRVQFIAPGKKFGTVNGKHGFDTIDIPAFGAEIPAQPAAEPPLFGA
jgi:hypothetical protein